MISFQQLERFFRASLTLRSISRSNYVSTIHQSVFFITSNYYQEIIKFWKILQLLCSSITILYKSCSQSLVNIIGISRTEITASVSGSELIIQIYIDSWLLSILQNQEKLYYNQQGRLVTRLSKGERYIIIFIYNFSWTSETLRCDCVELIDLFFCLNLAQP